MAWGFAWKNGGQGRQGFGGVAGHYSVVTALMTLACSFLGMRLSRTCLMGGTNTPEQGVWGGWTTCREMSQGSTC